MSAGYTDLSTQEVYTYVPCISSTYGCTDRCCNVPRVACWRGHSLLSCEECVPHHKRYGPAACANIAGEPADGHTDALSSPLPPCWLLGSKATHAQQYCLDCYLICWMLSRQRCIDASGRREGALPSNEDAACLPYIGVCKRSEDDDCDIRVALHLGRASARKLRLHRSVYQADKLSPRRSRCSIAPLSSINEGRLLVGLGLAFHARVASLEDRLRQFLRCS